MAPTLDAGTQPPIGVVTPSQLAVYVGSSPRQLLIFSGIAVPEWRSGGDLDREEVIVRLGATTTPNFGWTASVGLASINNEDSDFIFATDAASVDLDQNDGTLLLHVPIAVQGDTSSLSRFSYMVHVLSDPVQSKITGLISWARYFGDPGFSVLNGGNPMFRVAVGQTINIPTPPGQFQQTQFIETVAGFSSKPAQSGDLWVAAYEIDNVPLGQQWEVRPSLLSKTLAGPPAGYYSDGGFQPNPQMVQLTPSFPSAAGVDFTMSFAQLPR